MARLIDIHIVCDRCQMEKGPEARVEVEESITVAFDHGAPMEMDLCSEHAAEVRSWQQTIESTGRRVTPKRTRATASANSENRGAVYFKNAYGSYQCEECEFTATTPQGIAAHRRAKHDAVPITCEVCGKICSNHNGYMTHRRIHDEGAAVTCPDCGKSYLNRSGLASHLRMSGHGASSQPMIETTSRSDQAGSTAR